MTPPTRTEKKERSKTRGAPEDDSGRAPPRAPRTPGKETAVRRTATGFTAPVTAEPSSGRRSGKPRPAERSAEGGETRRRAPERPATRKAAAVRKTQTPPARPVKRRVPSRAAREPEGQPEKTVRPEREDQTERGGPPTTEGPATRRSPAMEPDTARGTQGATGDTRKEARSTATPSRTLPRRSAEAEPEPPVGETEGRMKGTEAPPPHAPKRESRKKRGAKVGPLDPEPSASDRRV